MKKGKLLLKKYYWVLLLFLLVIPIKISYQDGGSVSYHAILYKYIIWNPMPNNPFESREEQRILTFFPHNFYPAEFYLELKPEKVFAFVSSDNSEEPNNILDFVECNIGNYSIVKHFGKKTLSKNHLAVFPTFQEYAHSLHVKKDSFIYLQHLYSAVKEVRIYKSNQDVPLDSAISFLDTDKGMALQLNHLEIGNYIISFKMNLVESEIEYSFQIEVI